MIFWIASYPKSGNTWLRTLISAYYYTPDGNFNDGKCLNYISQFPNKKYFQGFNYKKDKVDDTARYWGAAQLRINSDKKIKFFKTHNALVKLGGYEFTNSSQSIGCIYIVRDPRNIISSLANHFELSIHESLEFMLNEKKFTYDFTKINDFSDFQFISSWHNNYNSWKNNKFIPVKFLRYEDLSKMTYSVVKEVILFIDKIINNKNKFKKKRLIKAIQSTSFEKLKNLEKERGFQESVLSKINNKNIPFFFKGPKNDWNKNFDKDFKKKINKIFKNDLEYLKYI